MLYNNFTEKLLGLQDVIVKNIEETETDIILEIELSRKTKVCPHCGRLTETVHDYRIHKIKDISIRGKNTIYKLQNAGIVVNVANVLPKRTLFFHVIIE